MDKAQATSIAVEFLAQKGVEDTVLTPYLCSARKATIGIGTTFYRTTPGRAGRAVSLKDAPITRVQAFDECRAFLAPVVDEIDKTMPWLTEKQAAAVAALIYNIGGPNWQSSTVRKRLLAKAPAAAIVEAWSWFNKTRDAAGVLQVSNGLINRRRKEIALFLS